MIEDEDVTEVENEVCEAGLGHYGVESNRGALTMSSGKFAVRNRKDGRVGRNLCLLAKTNIPPPASFIVNGTIGLLRKHE